MNSITTRNFNHNTTNKTRKLFRGGKPETPVVKGEDDEEKIERNINRSETFQQEPINMSEVPTNQATNNEPEDDEEEQEVEQSNIVDSNDEVKNANEPSTAAPLEEPTAVPVEEPTAAPLEEPTAVPTKNMDKSATENPSMTEEVEGESAEIQAFRNSIEPPETRHVYFYMNTNISTEENRDKSYKREGVLHFTDSVSVGSSQNAIMSLGTVIGNRGIETSTYDKLRNVALQKVGIILGENRRCYNTKIDFERNGETIFVHIYGNIYSKKESTV
jgi:hypothetical protein